jgi:hypothetical protein
VNDVLAHLRACHDVFGGNLLRILAEDTSRGKTGFAAGGWWPCPTLCQGGGLPHF